jgi:hypothetical protein
MHDLTEIHSAQHQLKTRPRTGEIVRTLGSVSFLSFSNWRSVLHRIAAPASPIFREAFSLP